MQTFTNRRRDQTKFVNPCYVSPLGLLMGGSLAVTLLGSCQQPQSPAPTSNVDNDATPTSSAEPAIARTKDPYINRLLPEAHRIRQEYGVPVDLTLAIAIHETGYGKHVIGQNNHFGLKCRTKDCVTLAGRTGTHQWENCADPSPCFDMFAKSIQDLSDGNFKNLKKIRREGYAVSPQWTRKVRRIRQSVRRQLKQAQKNSK